MADFERKKKDHVADLGLQCCILRIVHQVLDFPIGILGILEKKITTQND